MMSAVPRSPTSSLGPIRHPDVDLWLWQVLFALSFALALRRRGRLNSSAGSPLLFEIMSGLFTKKAVFHVGLVLLLDPPVLFLVCLPVVPLAVREAWMPVAPCLGRGPGALPRAPPRTVAVFALPPRALPCLPRALTSPVLALASRALRWGRRRGRALSAKGLVVQKHGARDNWDCL